ncbi:MAG: hypothetical protein K2O84_08940 [Oscillospiraceae bacterium]|nr:hypothetical protein [Oscillospiraceae bacterium]
MNNELMAAYWRQNKGAGTKLTMQSRVLIDTLTRLNCCAALLIQSVESAARDGVPRKNLLSLVGVCDLLETITGDLYEEVAEVYQECIKSVSL